MSLYSIWLAEFASIEVFPDALMIAGTLAPTTRRLPYTYVVLKSAEKTILIDIGFDFRDYAKALVSTMGLNNWQPPKNILGQLKINPEDVSDIIITHAHFDHMGGMDFFPNATFHIQERELTDWVWALAVNPKLQKLHFCVNPADILKMTELATQGRVRCIKGDADNYFDGIDLRIAHDTHTWGSQYVIIRNDGKTNSEDKFVMAGDLVYCYENMGETPETNGVYTPVVQAVGGQYNLLRAIESLIKSADGNPIRVIPAHEDNLGKHYKTIRGEYGLKITQIALAQGATGI